MKKSREERLKSGELIDGEEAHAREVKKVGYGARTFLRSDLHDIVTSTFEQLQTG